MRSQHLKRWSGKGAWGLPWYQKQSLSRFNPEPMRDRSEKCCSLRCSDSLMWVTGLRGMNVSSSLIEYMAWRMAIGLSLTANLSLFLLSLKKNVNDYTLLATPSSLLPLESSQETSQHSSFLSPHHDAENRTDSQPMAVEAQLSQNGVWLLLSSKWQDVNSGKAGASSHVRTENFSLSAWSDSINCMDHTQSKMLPMWELSG